MNARWYDREVDWRYMQLVAWVGMSLLVAFGFWLIRDSRADSRAEIVAEGRARALASCEAQNQQQKNIVIFIQRLNDLGGRDPARQEALLKIAGEVFAPRDCGAELQAIIDQVHKEQNQ